MSPLLRLGHPAKAYSDLLASVYRRLAEEWGQVVTWEECRTYGQSVVNWPAFADSRAGLGYLKQHFRLYVLTNTDNASFAGSNARLGVAFDGIFTAEECRQLQACRSELRIHAHNA